MHQLKEIASALTLGGVGVVLSLAVLLLQRREAGLDRASELASTVLLITVWVGLFAFRGFYRVDRRLAQLERAQTSRKDQAS